MLIALFNVGNHGLAEVTISLKYFLTRKQLTNFTCKVSTLQVLYGVLKRIVERCVQSHSATATLCISLLDKALNLQSATVWRYILRADSVVFQECGKVIERSVLDNVLESMAKFRERDDHSCKGDLDLVLILVWFEGQLV